MDRAKPGLASAWRKFELRAYRLADGSPLVGITVAAAEARIPEHRLFVHRLRRGERILEATPDVTIEAGDVVAISGPRPVIVEQIGARAQEIEDSELLDVPVTMADVLLMNPQLAGTNLGDASKEDWTRGLYLRRLSRGSQELPVAAGVVLQRGDVLRIVGGVSHTESGREDRRRHRSRHKHRFCCFGAGDFPGRRSWRSHHFFRRRR
jgi:putative transport protein